MIFNDNISMLSESFTPISTTVIAETEKQPRKKQKLCYPVRKYLEPNSDNTLLLCSLCETTFFKKTGIGTMKRHFKNNHEDVYKQLDTTQNTDSPYTEEDSERIESIE